VKPSLASEQGMFWGILIAIAIGLPLFVYGNLNKILALNLAGTLIAIFGSIVLVLAISQWKRLKK
jgi:hypothetical protein